LITTLALHEITPYVRSPEHAAVLGAATGMRSTVALAALIVRRSDGLPAVLKHPAGHRGPIPSMLTASVAALAAAKICHDARPRSPAAFRTPRWRWPKTP
jgi:hypothetical protein